VNQKTDAYNLVWVQHT